MATKSMFDIAPSTGKVARPAEGCTSQPTNKLMLTTVMKATPIAMRMATIR